jgi:hypothetical protein
MANMEKAGVSDPIGRDEIGRGEIGPGEALELRQKRRQSLILALLMIAGGITGLVLSLNQEAGASLLAGTLAPGVAIALIALWLVAVVGGSFWLSRHIDEIERAAQLWGVATGGILVVVLFPVWHLLWRGQIAPEPNAYVLFAALYGMMLVAYLWKKFR